MSKRTCDIPECDNELPEGRGSHGGAMLCDACLGSRTYWRRQGPQALAARKTRLMFWSARADYLLPFVGPAIKKARAAVAAAKQRARDHATRHH